MDSNDTLTWRPQAFGRRNVRDIVDPIIEPMWIGERVIVHVVGERVEMVDTQGDPVKDEVEAILGQLLAGIQSHMAVLDGYLTRQATPVGGTVYLVGTQLPTAGEMTSQMLVGRGLRARALTKLDEERKEDRANPLAFVAVDLLALDEQPLFDIPLLERKRLLESVLGEGELVRRSAFIRPPVDTWLASWRSVGFRELAYKAANGRYQPGSTNDTWAIVRIPTN